MGGLLFLNNNLQYLYTGFYPSSNTKRNFLPDSPEHDIYLVYLAIYTKLYSSSAFPVNTKHVFSAFQSRHYSHGNKYFFCFDSRDDFVAKNELLIIM